MKPKVVITDWGFPSLQPEEEVFRPHGIELEAHQCKSEQEVALVVENADVVMAQWAPVRKMAIEAMSHCKGIVRYGIGLDNIDLESAKAKGIPVRNVPDYCLDEVADHTIALVLALQRQVVRVFDLVRAGTWKITPPLELPPLRKSKLGLVGFGRIAQLVAIRAKPFGMSILASDPFVSSEIFGKAQVQQTTLEELLSSADIVSLHCPLTPETRHILNKTNIGRMKKTVLIVNTSRGGLVETQALVNALKAGNVAGAALDVLEVEPVPADSLLLSFPNVIVTSHTAWYSSESVGELQHRAALVALDLLNSAKQ